MPISTPPPAAFPVPGRTFLIVTPCDDGHKLCFWQSVRDFERLYYTGQLKTPHTFLFRTVPGDSLVPRARNNLAHFWRTQTDFDYLLPLDSDLDFRPEEILRFADTAASRDLDFLCGLYAIKQDELRWCINYIPSVEVDEQSGLHEVSCAPGGIHAIHRRMLTRMIEAAPTWPHWHVEYQDDNDNSTRYNFYFNGVVKDAEYFPDKPRGRYLSEDWGISYFARKLGFKIWCDTKVIMLHRGECFYPMQAHRMTKAEQEAAVKETV